MQNLDKIRTPVFDLTVKRPESFGLVGKLFWRFAPLVFKTFSAGLMLPVFQLFLVGAADRFGISPKWSVIFSSLFFVFMCGGLAVLGGVKEKVRVKESDQLIAAEPICKILMIRRKNIEGNL